MDNDHRPQFSGPMFPFGSRSQGLNAANRLRGTIVGVRSGRGEEAKTTRIVTIKLTEYHVNPNSLLHADVELIVDSKS